MREIKIVKLKDVKSNPNNPRIIKDDKFKKLVKSIQEFPEMLNIRPIVVNSDLIVLGGNMRLKACNDAGLKEIPIIIADELTDEQQREFIIKDNVGYGEWDWDMLKNEWIAEELEEWGLDIPEMENDIILEAEEDDYEVPEEGIITDIVIGDLFEIGEHRLLCGDSTDSDAVAKLMNAQKADMVFTSPPYNSGDVAMRGGGKFAFGKTGAKTLYENYKDDKTPQEYFDFCISILNNISLIVNELHSIFWNVSYNANSRDDYGKIVFADVNPFRVKETIIWNKGVAIPITSEGILSRNSEFIFLMSNGNKYLTNQKIGEHSVYWNTWNISSSGSQKNEHKACFPVELPFKAIEDFSKSDSIIYEPFTGSGTTMVAAHQLKRKCYGMELDPKYCQVIIDRMKKLDPTLTIKRNGQII
jgi:DNA modification methylase